MAKNLHSDIEVLGRWYDMKPRRLFDTLERDMKAYSQSREPCVGVMLVHMAELSSGREEIFRDIHQAFDSIRNEFLQILNDELDYVVTAKKQVCEDMIVRLRGIRLRYCELLKQAYIDHDLRVRFVKMLFTDEDRCISHWRAIAVMKSRVSEAQEKSIECLRRGNSGNACTILNDAIAQLSAQSSL